MTCQEKQELAESAPSEALVPVDGHGDLVKPAADAPPRRHRRGRRRALWGIGAVTVAAAVAGGAWYVTGRDDGTDTPAVAAPVNTATVARRDLAQTEKVNGTLGYGDERTVLGGLQGVVTALPGEGAVVTRGQALYRVDNRPVTLLYGDLPLYRTLRDGVDNGPDIRVVEQNLAALGYGGFTVDEEYTDATANAVSQWQSAVGLPDTGRVEPGDVFVAADAVRISSLKAQVGGRAATGQPLLAYTGTARLVSVDLDVELQALAKAGGKVTVTLPDGKKVPGTVASVGTVARAVPAPQGQGQPAGTDQPTATIDVTVTLDDPGGAGTLDAAPVDVDLVSDERKGVLVVPVAALLALREGGYGVEIVEGGTTRLIAVEVGLFSNGLVEVKGPDIAEGMAVGVPKP